MDLDALTTELASLVERGKTERAAHVRAVIAAGGDTETASFDTSETAVIRRGPGRPRKD